MQPHPAIALKGVWKIFDGVPVLRDIDFDLMPGEIHALLGGNGSGKSTTVKILSGAYQPTAGAIEIDGKPVSIDRPSKAHDLGIYMVPQEPHIFPHLSVAENLLMGKVGQSPGALDRARKLATEMGLASDFDTPGGFLSIANQQLIEILRGLLRNARILILDEPTSALTVREVENLFRQMRRLVGQGITILFISHRLNEVLEIADRISVLRDGAFVLRTRTPDTSVSALIEAMVPGTLSLAAEKQERRAALAAGAEPLLQVENLSGEVFRDVSFEVRAGEVVGLAGLVGAGRTELCRAILGIDPAAGGVVRICGQTAQHRTPRLCQELGLVYVPEDRHAHGIFLELANALTVTASVLPSLGRFFLSPRKEAVIAEDFMQRLAIKVSGPDQLARTLSGGNQQKVVLSKALATRPRVIILDEPTRGIDAKARQDVYRAIRRLTAEGLAVLLISSEMGEVAELSDRILVMLRGRLTALPQGHADIETISAATFGLTGAAS